MLNKWLKTATMKTLLAIIIFVPILCFGQKQGNIWYFGNHAGVDFNSGSPIALLDGQIAFPLGNSYNEGTTSISDSTGAILFYSDGMTVWNKDHQVMQNGTGLLGNFSSTHSSIVVPDPADPNQYYYLFTVGSLMGAIVDGNVSDGLRYSRVDMCLDNSRGAIIPAEKNILLVDTVAEKIAVTRHSNGNDYWIVTHKYYSNEFWALKLSASGIVDTVVTAIGSFHTGSQIGVLGQIKFSPNGQRIAIAAANGLEIFELFDFDNTTGVISNFMPIYKPNNDQADVYGVEFSPDNSKLYACGKSSTGNAYDFLAQYDLTAGGGDLSLVNASIIEIYTATVSAGYKGLQLAPDGKIYLVSVNGNSQGGDALSVIHNPDMVGFGCNYQDQAISLGGRQGSYTLPSFIAGYDYSNKKVRCLTIGIDDVSKDESIKVFPNPFSTQTELQTDKYFKNATLRVYNIDGETVMQMANLSGQTIVLHRNNLPSGLYFLRLMQDNKIVSSKKLVITD